MNVLQSNGYNSLIGIDSSHKMIERGKSEFPSLDLRVTNGKELPFESSSVDAVVLCGVLTCIVKNKEQLSFISEVKRVLREHGILYINDFLLNDDARHILRYNTFKQKYNCFGVFELTEGVALRHHSREWLEILLNCFEKLEYEEVIYKTMNGHESKGFYFIGGKRRCAVAKTLPNDQ